MGYRDLDSVREAVREQAFAQRIRIREQGCPEREIDGGRLARAHCLFCLAVLCKSSGVSSVLNVCVCWCVHVWVCMCVCMCVCVRACL